MSTNFLDKKIRKIDIQNEQYTIVGTVLHGTAAEWSTHGSYIPQQGEIVVYDGNGSEPAKIKIGDGSTTVANLNFSEGNSKSNLYTQNEEPENAPEGSWWIDLDEESVDTAMYRTYVEEVDDLLGGES